MKVKIDGLDEAELRYCAELADASARMRAFYEMDRASDGTD